MITSVSRRIINNFKLTNKVSILHKYYTDNNRKLFFATYPLNEVLKTEEKIVLPTKPTNEKVKEIAGDIFCNTVFYGAILIAGATVILLYEEFLTETNRSVFYNSLADCRKNTKVMKLLGDNIVAYGHSDRGNKQRYTTHWEWLDKQGKQHINMMYTLEGTLAKAVVYLDMEKDDQWKYQYKYMYVKPESEDKSKFYIVDNRK